MRDAVLVLGAHRNGTSALTGALSLLGATLPNHCLDANEFNARGYFESRHITGLNDAILAAGGSNWNDWREFHLSRLDPAAASAFSETATSLVLKEFECSPLIALKDPRICRMMPFWYGALGNAGYRSRNLLIVRNPLEVAESLQYRDGFPIGRGLLIWLRNVIDVEASSRGRGPRSVVIWSEFHSNWRRAVEKSCAELDLTWPRRLDEIAAEVEAFLSSELRHHEIDEDILRSHPKVYEWVRAAFEAHKQLSADPGSTAALDTLDSLRALFNDVSGLHAPVLSALETQGLDTMDGRSPGSSVHRNPSWSDPHEKGGFLQAQFAELAGGRLDLQRKLQAVSANLDEATARERVLATRLVERDRDLSRAQTELQAALETIADQAHDLIVSAAQRAASEQIAREMSRSLKLRNEELDQAFLMRPWRLVLSLLSRAGVLEFVRIGRQVGRRLRSKIAPDRQVAQRVGID